LIQAGIAQSIDMIPVTKNGVWGLNLVQSIPPSQGAGSETNPRLVLNNPKAVPRSSFGTTLLIREE